jgi:hypothetical protein
VNDIGDIAHNTVVVALDFSDEQILRLFVGYIEFEAFDELFHRFVGLESNVRDVRIDHKREEIEN